MIPVKILKISYQPSTRNYYLVLKELDGDHCFPLTIGSSEAQSIALALESVEPTRPMTHDLICRLLSEIDLSLKRVRITDIKDGVFYSYIDIESKIFGKKEIDARPSDAIAIALRENAPILVSKKLINYSGIDHKTFVHNNDKEKLGKLLKKLKLELRDAVRDENYEIAAELRDKIRKIDP